MYQGVTDVSECLCFKACHMEKHLIEKSPSDWEEMQTGNNISGIQATHRIGNEISTLFESCLGLFGSAHSISAVGSHLSCGITVGILSAASDATVR